MSQQTPQQFLQTTPRGAYTTLLAREGRFLVDWPTHLERLVRSLRALHTAVNGFYHRYYAWLESSGAQNEAAALQQLLAPAIQAALASVQHAAAAAQDVMLIVVLPAADKRLCGLDICVHAHACMLPDCSPGSAVVLGGPRSVPVGKDSGWVSERQPLEAQRPRGAAEVLLSSKDGRLLEGLVTNLFVVTQGPQGGSEGRAVVWTAGMQDGVVWGTARARVLQACRRLGIAVREEAPSAASRGTWREAFITNSLRQVQPLSSITCAAGNVWGHPAWEAQLPLAPGPITAALRAAMLEAQPTTDASWLGHAAAPAAVPAASLGS